jgi:hypothetical protein
LLVHPVVAADPRNVTARGEEKGHPVRIADREAPVASLRERGFQRAPRGPVRGERRAGTAAGLAGEAREGPSDAGDALAQRDVGQVQQPGDLAAAHTDVDEQGHQATGAGQRGDERVRQSRQGPGGALRREAVRAANRAELRTAPEAQGRKPGSPQSRFLSRAESRTSCTRSSASCGTTEQRAATRISALMVPSSIVTSEG